MLALEETTGESSLRVGGLLPKELSNRASHPTMYTAPYSSPKCRFVVATSHLASQMYPTVHLRSSQKVNHQIQNMRYAPVNLAPSEKGCREPISHRFIRKVRSKTRFDVKVPLHIIPSLAKTFQAWGRISVDRKKRLLNAVLSYRQRTHSATKTAI